MQLSYNQKMQLFESGYVVIPGVVPTLMIKEALKAVNHSLGKGIPEGHKGANYCQELEKHPAITNLFNKTPAKTLIDTLIGENNFYPINGAQIALRFPDYQDPPNPYAGAHLDGMLKLKEGIVENFTALVGILLSDQPEPNMGNFIVYPGSHRLCEQYFRENGPDILLEEETFQTKHRPINMQLPEPVQITGQAGDIVISHYQMIHAGGPNTSPFIRYSCYYRVYHSEIRNNWKAPLTDLWMHWPGLRDVLNK
ncbi:phytanoyl-CoA dioxygenase family protein [Paenibacillus thermotolerans]|uniref:phytanoyl-CoA dioxygenase family protein n=1 Tax=Paenibacillus thermotolerans TaxID=3027807 RepID=UPI0023688629|nr:MULTISPECIES: phytanoyl-CoA dioxygenase family protein [unclassified Paenibacillus]